MTQYKMLQDRRYKGKIIEFGKTVVCKIAGPQPSLLSKCAKGVWPGHQLRTHREAPPREPRMVAEGHAYHDQDGIVYEAVEAAAHRIPAAAEERRSLAAARTHPARRCSLRHDPHNADGAASAPVRPPRGRRDP